MAIKQIPSEKPIRELQLAAIAQDYRFTIVGNYHSSASHLIKAALVQRLLQVKKMVVGLRARKMTLVLTNPAFGLSSLATRTCRQFGIETSIEPDLPPEERAGLELLLTVKLDLSDKVAEQTRDDLDQQYEREVEPWDENDKRFEIVVPVAIDLVDKSPVNLTKVDLPTPVNDKRNDYSPFAKTKLWLDEVIQEVEPTIDRNRIPAYGPDIAPDGNKAGGLQESSLQLAAVTWDQQLKRKGFAQSPHNKNAWIKPCGDLGNGHPYAKIQVRKVGGPSVGEPEQWHVSVLGFSIHPSTGRTVSTAVGEPDVYDDFTAALKYILSIAPRLEKHHG